MRHAWRRDNNEHPLIEIAERLGWWLTKMDQPADFLALRRGQWHVIEIKNPECEGHADELTAKQKIFHKDVFNRGGKVLIWRTSDDVYRDSHAKVSA